MNENGYMKLDNFEALYERFGPMVLRRCKFLLGDEDQALDVMQDVFVRILERRDRMDSVCSSLFWTVATNLCLNRIRSDRVRYAPQIDHLLDGMADGKRQHEELVDTSLFLDYVFTDTKDDTRYMATLHYVDGLTLEETAKETGLSVSGVRKRLAGLRRKALACAGE